MSENFLYSELFWSGFFRIWIEHGDILRISPYSVRMRENADQNNSEYGTFYVVFFCLVLLVVCDAKYTFTLIDIGNYENNNDCGISAESLIWKKFDNNEK